MNASSAIVERARGHRPVLAILVGGLVAGTLDIGAASLINMIDPRVILRFIAGGLLGKAALQGGPRWHGWGCSCSGACHC